MPRPLVSAVMVTGHRPERRALALASIESFLAQTQDDKELIIVNEGEPLLSARWHPDSASELAVAPGKSLGELRNIGAEAATGTWIAQWDDDDWHAEEFLHYQLSCAQSRPDNAVLLRGQLRYDFTTNRAFYLCWPFAKPPGIPGTVLYPNQPHVRYRALARSEDDLLLTDHFKDKISVIPEAPGVPVLYIRFFHGANTWDQGHVMCRPGQPNSWQVTPTQARYLVTVLTKYYSKFLRGSLAQTRLVINGGG